MEKFKVPSFAEHLNEEAIYKDMLIEHINEMASPKDIKRIEDIVSRSKGSKSKQLQLAKSMAKKITKKDKIKQRFEAALDVLGAEDPVTLVFADAAKKLGVMVDFEAPAKKEKTPGSLGADDPKLKKMGRKLGRPAPVLPIGSVNLATGKCKYFNIYDTWGEGQETTIEVWKDMEHSGKIKFVITSGLGPIVGIGNNGCFIHDQTGRDIFCGTMIDWAAIGDANLIMKKYGKSAIGYVYK